MAANKPGYQAPAWEPNLATLTRRICEFLRQIVKGKINCTLDVTLTANASSTTVKDARIGYFSHIGLGAPLTAHAAAEIAAGGFYVSAQQTGQCTLAHANNAQLDRTFRLSILG